MLHSKYLYFVYYSILTLRVLRVVNHSGASIMVWLCLSCNGVGSLYNIYGILDKGKYVDIRGVI